ncbi:uncharacterized protein FA14DRAFT_6176 [Meira miltonrushii]|uniref:Uncharacterized protein n=1 Tax=Meira miltonrushii TaxID=1280837 RepID=A0A316VGN2_9BASI|nr:uncharacterized protein FA14DRAFT_6176 [Meira miltonrushii]PWN36752.1 hypothetical protein FA14DRAFT_6176 [Meira miltonrushii]
MVHRLAPSRQCYCRRWRLLAQLIEFHTRVKEEEKIISTLNHILDRLLQGKMTTQLIGSWSLDVNGKGKDTSSLPSPNDKKAIEVEKGDFGSLNAGLHDLRQDINDVLTQWKDAIGDEGQAKNSNNADQQEEEDSDDGDD